MYVTLYAAANQQIVLDTIKDTENAKQPFINHYTFDGNKTSVTSEVQDGVSESAAKELLGIIKYIHKFYTESGQTDMGVPGCCALVVSTEEQPQKQAFRRNRHYSLHDVHGDRPVHVRGRGRRMRGLFRDSRVFMEDCVSLPSNGAYWGHCGYAQRHQHD